MAKTPSQIGFQPRTTPAERRAFFDLQRQLATIEGGDTTDLQTQIDTLDARLDAVDTQLDAVDTQLAALDARLDVLEAAVPIPVPTQRGATTTGTGTYGTGITVTRPTGLVASDVTILTIFSESMTDPAFTCAGFTVVFFDADNASNLSAQTVLVGTGHSGAGSFTITSPTLGSGVWCVRVCTSWQDADPAVIVGTAYSQSSGGLSVVPIPGITTIETDTLVLASIVQQYGGATAVTGMTLLGAADGTMVSQWSLLQAAAGATGDIDATMAAAYSSIVGLLIGIPPP